MTLLERWDSRMKAGTQYVSDEEIRRAIAIAQAVEESWGEKIGVDRKVWISSIMRRADELLKEEP